MDVISVGFYPTCPDAILFSGMGADTIYMGSDTVDGSIMQVFIAEAKTLISGQALTQPRSKKTKGDTIDFGNATALDGAVKAKGQGYGGATFAAKAALLGKGPETPKLGKAAHCNMQSATMDFPL